MPDPSISIIIPVLNEAPTIRSQLDALQALRGSGTELIVVDGGSDDETVAQAQPLVDRLLVSQRGRARQMNCGAEASRGEILLFLHADTSLPAAAARVVSAAIGAGGQWGRFDVHLRSPRRVLRVVESMMNWRSRLTGIATGDQAIFIRRDLFERVGGFPDLALMEDIALSARLKRVAAPACLRQVVATSARRWEKNGVWRTIFLMWRLRAEFFFGKSPDALALRYGRSPHER